MPLNEIVPTSGQDNTATDHDESSVLDENDGDAMELSLLSKSDSNSNRSVKTGTDKVDSFSINKTKPSLQNNSGAKTRES